MASTEDKAYEIMRELDVNYVLVIFGGLTGYSSDGQWKWGLRNNTKKRIMKNTKKNDEKYKKNKEKYKKEWWKIQKIIMKNTKGLLKKKQRWM